MKILFVCHANLCRSPMAEALTRHRFGTAVTVRSAGTHGWDGSPMHAGTAAVLAERGVDPGDFVSRTVDARMLADADLILTAERTHRAACVTLAPASIGRTFTIRQFARLAAAVPPGTSGGVVERVAAVRHLVTPGADDLDDPVGRPIEAFRTCADEIETQLDAIEHLIPA